VVNLQYVYHTGANVKYFDFVLRHMKEYNVSVTKQKLNNFCSTLNTDVLVYQTFPDQYNKKFNKALSIMTDKLFDSFSGLKILLCTHDCGDIDSYSRMANSKELPRIKCFPTQWFLDNYNVILVSSFSVNNLETYPDTFDRDIQISCKFGDRGLEFYHHKIRNSVVENLKKYFYNMTDFEWVVGKLNYIDHLKRVQIAIGAPGWGRYNGTYSGALRTGALLFAHRSLNDIKYLPHDNLIDGEDFISYDLFNFKIKLERLLNAPDEIERIRNNGREKFKIGYDPKKSADQFFSYLKKELKL